MKSMYDATGAPRISDNGVQTVGRRFQPRALRSCVAFTPATDSLCSCARLRVHGKEVGLRVGVHALEGKRKKMQGAPTSSPSEMRGQSVLVRPNGLCSLRHFGGLHALRKKERRRSGWRSGFHRDRGRHCGWLWRLTPFFVHLMRGDVGPTKTRGALAQAA